MKQKYLAILVLASLLLSFRTALAQAPQPPVDAQSTTGPIPPRYVNIQGIRVAPNTTGQLSPVPAYIWTHGCGPTAAGMIIGYWDTKWFGKLVPGDAHSQSLEVSEMIASSQGMLNHYNDYALPLDSFPYLIPDRSEPPAGDEHISNSLADFMHTSFSANGNYYGWSWFSDFGPALQGYVNYANVTYGSSYHVTTSNYYMYNGSFNWDLFRSEIDAGRPVGMLVDINADGHTDHFITAFGYDDTTGTKKYAALNTWDTDVHWYDFVSMAPGVPWGIFGATTMQISSFQDAPAVYWAWSWIERLYAAGITGGCGSGIYCPESSVTRAQMAIFLERGMKGSSYTPPTATGTAFADVPSAYWAAAWIEQLAADGITAGCGGSNYCPDDPVTRAQMAVFLLKSKYGSSYIPPAVGSSTGFSDVTTDYWAASWIKQLAAEGITGGCGTNLYCPESPVTRAQMAVFLVRTFNLP